MTNSMSEKEMFSLLGHKKKRVEIYVTVFDKMGHP